MSSFSFSGLGCLVERARREVSAGGCGGRTDLFMLEFLKTDQELTCAIN